MSMQPNLGNSAPTTPAEPDAALSNLEAVANEMLEPTPVVDRAEVPQRPRLRALDVFPATIDGQNLICLRDPSGLSEDVMALPRGLLPLLEAMDGTRTVVDLQVAEMQRQGRIVLDTEIEGFVRELDSHLFLASDRLEAKVNQTASDFRRAP